MLHKDSTSPYLWSIMIRTRNRFLTSHMASLSSRLAYGESMMTATSSGTCSTSTATHAKKKNSASTVKRDLDSCLSTAVAGRLWKRNKRHSDAWAKRILIYLEIIRQTLVKFLGSSYWSVLTNHTARLMKKLQLSFKVSSCWPSTTRSDSIKISWVESQSS